MYVTVNGETTVAPVAGLIVGGFGATIEKITDVSPIRPLAEKAIFALAIGPKLVAVKSENVALPDNAFFVTTPFNVHDPKQTEAVIASELVV